MSHRIGTSNGDVLRLGNRLENCPVTVLNGPGRRWAIWTQGCSLRCTDNCLNPRFLDPRGGWRYRVPEVVDELDRVHGRTPELEGLTLLGGEPFDQAQPLTKVAQAARERGLSVMVYSGWRAETLARRGPPYSRDLLSACDLLIDGPFLAEQFDSRLRWRGSRNQRIILLSDRYTREEIAASHNVKGIEVRLSDGQLQLNGAQDRGLLDGIARRLQASGFLLRSPANGEDQAW